MYCMCVCVCVWRGRKEGQKGDSMQVSSPQKWEVSIYTCVGRVWQTQVFDTLAHNYPDPIQPLFCNALLLQLDTNTCTQRKRREVE